MVVHYRDAYIWAEVDTVTKAAHTKVICCVKGSKQKKVYNAAVGLLRSDLSQLFMFGSRHTHAHTLSLSLC